MLSEYLSTLIREALQKLLAILETNIFAIDIDDSILLQFLYIAIEDFAYGADQACYLFVRKIMDKAQFALVMMVDIFGDKPQQSGGDIIKRKIERQGFNLSQLLGDIGKKQFVETGIMLHPPSDYLYGEDQDRDTIKRMDQVFMDLFVQQCDYIVHIAMGEDLECLLLAVLEVDL